MTRPFIPLIAIAALAAPLPATAQAWPATVASGAHKVKVRPDGVALASARTGDWVRDAKRTAGNGQRIVLRHDFDAEDFAEAPDVDLRPKAEWFDDQGLRVGPTKLAYKQRF